MFAVGFETIEDVASVTPEEFIRAVKNVSLNQAEKIVKTAKKLVREKIELYQDQIEDMKIAVKTRKRPFVG